MKLHKRIIPYGFTLLAALSIAACSGSGDGKRCPIGEPCPTDDLIPQLNDSTSSSNPSCTATIDKAVSPSGEQRTISLAISGGQAPYHVPGFKSGVGNSTSIQGAWNNNTASAVTLNKTVTIVDSRGRSGSCGFTVQISPSGTGGTGTGGLSCTAAIQGSSTVYSEDPVTLRVNGAGGTRPYRIYLGKDSSNNEVWNFFNTTSYTEVSGSFTNTGTADLSLTRTAKIKDDAGNTATCNFNIVVKADNRLACTLSTTSSIVRPNADVEFIAEAKGGTAPYTWLGFSSGNGATSTRTVINSTKLSVLTQYANSGSFNPVIGLRDAANNEVSCQTKVSVAQPSLALSGATSAPMGSTVRVLATAAGFDLTKFIAFEAASSNAALGVSITTLSGGKAYIDVKAVDSDDRSARTTEITVKATSSNGDVAEKKHTINFLSTSLACDVRIDSIPYANNSVRISGVSSQVNDIYLVPVDLTGASNASLYKTDGTAAYKAIDLNYPSANSYNIKVKGYSPSRREYCGGGSTGIVIDRPVVVTTRLSSCYFTSSNIHSAVNEPVTFNAVLAANSGSGPFAIELRVSDKVVSRGAWTGPATTEVGPANGTAKAVKFNYSGSFDVQMFITDAGGTTISCGSLEQRVRSNAGILAEAYNVNSGFRLSTAWDPAPGYPAGSLINSFIATQINVPDRDGDDHVFPQVGRNERFAVVYRGSINITEPGCYRFRVKSDDGAVLLLDGEVLTSWVGKRDYDSDKSEYKCYNADQLGLHPFILKYFQWEGDFGVVLSWKRPCDGSFRVIEPHYFAQDWMGPWNPTMPGACRSDLVFNGNPFEIRDFVNSVQGTGYTDPIFNDYLSANKVCQLKGYAKVAWYSDVSPQYEYRRGYVHSSNPAFARWNGAVWLTQPTNNWLAQVSCSTCP